MRDASGWRATVTVVALVILLAATAGVGTIAWQTFAPLFPVQLDLKADQVASAMARRIDRAVAYDIPLDQVRGVGTMFETELERSPEISFALLIDAGGNPLVARGLDRLAAGDIAVAALSGDSFGRFRLRSAAIGPEEAPVAAVVLGVPLDYSAQVARDILLDIVAVAIVACLIAFELLLFVAHRATSGLRDLQDAADRAEAGDFTPQLSSDDRGPLGQVATQCSHMLDQVNTAFRAAVAQCAGAAAAALEELKRRYRFRDPDQTATLKPVRRFESTLVRLPLFLFAFAEDLTRPFLPTFIRDTAGAEPGMSSDLLVAVPISVFMLVWAISQPIGASLSGRLGRRRLFVIGAIASLTGLALTATAQSFNEILAWRILTALGYGTVLISLQGMVIDGTSPRQRALGMATLVGGLLAAGICGPALGGVIAEEIGPRATFLVSAGFAALSLLVLLLGVHRMPPPRPANGSAAKPTWRDGLKLLSNSRFLALMLFSAIPTKLTAVGLLFFLFPLYLVELGASSGDVGRAQMMYFIAFMLGAPMAAALSDRWGDRRSFVVGGGLAGIVAMLPLLVIEGPIIAGLCLLGFGFAQSAISAPQLALVTDLARTEAAAIGETTVVGVFRLIERIGGVLAPTLAATLAIAYGYLTAILVMAAIASITALMLRLTLAGTAVVQPPPRSMEAA